MTNNLAIRILSGEVLGTNEQTHEAVYMAIKALKAEPIRHGKWIHNGFMEVKCNNCGNVFHELEDTNYCPACGCHMDDVVWGEDGYIFDRLLEECEFRMHDREMNVLIQDLAKVLHDLEWWQSSDISEEAYRKTVSEFKKKWLGGDNREERLKDMINEIFNEAKKEALKLIGEES